MYMEIAEDTCKVRKEQQCASCKNGWLAPFLLTDFICKKHHYQYTYLTLHYKTCKFLAGSMMGRIPRPFPNEEKLKYKLKCI